MSQSSARLLFIPVSGPRGMGEYARCLAIATALAQRVPSLEVRFALSRDAPYAADTPFAATLLPSSATFHPREIRALIGEFRPRVVVFDNAGRTSQLRAAHGSGARVVYVSSRQRQRRRAFRLRWMPLIDEHWIAWPQFIAGAPTLLERLKLGLLGRPRIRFIDTLLPPTDPARAARSLQRFSLAAGDYVLIVPGGGSAHPGAEHAPAIVAAAARGIARRTAALLVGAAGPAGEAAALRTAPRLPMAELCELIRAARLVVSNGGDTLLQVLACGKPCVAVPIAHDQQARIDSCVTAGLAVAAPLEAAAIEAAALRVLQGEAAGAALPARETVRNGLEEVLGALEAMLV